MRPQGTFFSGLNQDILALKWFLKNFGYHDKKMHLNTSSITSFYIHSAVVHAFLLFSSNQNPQMPVTMHVTMAQPALSLKQWTEFSAHAHRGTLEHSVKLVRIRD